MQRFKMVLAVVGAGTGALALVAGAGWWWVGTTVEARLDQRWEAHGGAFPVPLPLTPEEVDALQQERVALATVAEGAATQPLPEPPAADELAAIALERAIARGKHLVEARYACVECHGMDFGGGKMIDDPVMGTVLGPNLTRGGVVAAYTPADWDRKVRHGVRPDGRSGLMPSEDYQRMSDRELSDIVAYIQSVPLVDRVVPPVALGPLGRVLLATDQLTLAAARLPPMDHHDLEPPATADTQAFGEHVLGVCTGCHRANFEGGPIAGGDPSWLPAANLSPHADGLAAWTRDDFVRVMRSGIRPDGTAVGLPMTSIVPYGARSEDVELHAMWTALQATPAVPDGR
jgi:mono/diheme cytochrome c family protein